MIQEYYILRGNEMILSHLHAAVAITRALGHSARLRTVAMLRAGELCVCQITEVLKLAPSTVSLHLKELKRSGVITEHKEGRWVHIGLSEDPEVRPWIDTALAAVAGDPQLEADDRMVAELRRLPIEDLCRLGYEKARAKRARAGKRRTRKRDSTS
jgi:ArsR family transcriptional regulator, arsenate/arsenite/antimonite-responsive transcriptional repressor